MAHTPLLPDTEPTIADCLLKASVDRRSFLRYTGSAAVVGGLLLAGCKDDDDDAPAPATDGRVNLGSGDIGVLNYAYALEQLEAAFYEEVLKGSYYSSASSAEKSIFKDLRDHEVIHREFFKRALGSNAIGSLGVNFSSINFNDRTSVIDTAIAFEDLGVSAYNGAGKLIRDTTYLLLAGKIVSVEARHAAAVRDLKSNGSFAATTDMNGLDPARTVAQVLDIAKTYLTSTLNADNVGK